MRYVIIQELPLAQACLRLKQKETYFLKTSKPSTVKFFMKTKVRKLNLSFPLTFLCFYSIFHLSAYLNTQGATLTEYPFLVMHLAFYN